MSVSLKLCRSSFRLAATLGCIVVGLQTLMQIPTVQADTVGFLPNIVEPASGEFEWDNFSGSYLQNHSPDIGSTGIGTAFIAPSVGGGLVTSTANLYTFMVPSTSLTVSGNSLKSDAPYTSLVLQFASPDILTDMNFSIGGIAPTNFEFLGEFGSTGFGAYRHYWAEWQGLAAANSLAVSLGSFGQHNSIGGARLSYVNSSDPNFNITAVPEPQSALLGLLGTLGLACLRSRRTSRS